MTDRDDDLPDEEFAALLDDARRGSGAALDTLVRSVDRRLVGFLGARGAEDPPGLANEVLVSMCRSVEGFEGNQRQFRAWVFQIARNRLIDEHRRSRRRVTERAEEPETLSRLGGSVELGGDLEARDRVERLLANLTEEQREVVVLRVIAGLSVEEVAEVVGRRAGAVRALQHRALRHLRAVLVEEA